MKTVADTFAEILAAVGVKRIYGIVGDSLNGLTDAIRPQAKIEWVHVRHEEVAGRRSAPDRRARRLWTTIFEPIGAQTPQYLVLCKHPPCKRRGRSTHSQTSSTFSARLHCIQASTFPLQIVQADRWITDNQDDVQKGTSRRSTAGRRIPRCRR
jgi:hypothetical protein